MDSGAFDRLARRLAGTASRRSAFAGLGAVLTRFLAPQQAEAQPRTTCREVGKVCIPERNIDCCLGSVCQDGRCACPQGKRRCGDRCIPANRCCNKQCSGGAVCRNDRCVCRPGRKRCQGRCIPKGQCCRDGECGPNRACRKGRCRSTGCGAGTKPCNGSCIPTAACCGGCGAGLTCRNGGCCNVTTAAELTAALGDGGPDTIELCPNTTYVGTFTISRDVTIIGAGAASSVLDGNGAGRVLTITDGVQVTLRRLRVTGGQVVDRGGGIFVALGGAGLTLEDVEVSGNQAGTGGGIVADNATLVLLGASRVANNTTTGIGGGIYGSAATITLRDTSEVTANTGESGGGIYAAASTVTLLGQSRLHANTAAQTGGGIRLDDSSPLELREQSAITANTARQNSGDSGGGIYSQGSSVQIQDQAQVTGNSPDNCEPNISPPNGTCV